jgi:ABC-type transport system involved in multi-copper enzyme maturation permease subunit
VSATAVRIRQIRALAALETGRRFLGRRAIPLYVICLVPLVVFGGRALAGLFHAVEETVAYDQAIFAVLFRTLLLRFLIFFSCVVVFGSLVRGEILDRSLHYTLLAPMRRDDVALGKYLSGLVAVLAVVPLTVALSWAGLHLAHGPGALADAFLTANGLGLLARYLAATVLACVGYGALFLLVGVVFRSPMIPALALLGWEGINFLLPPLLKKISVVHYVESLVPLSMPNPSIAILATPSSPWIAVPGVLAVSAAFVWLAIRRLRRVEVLYGVE